MTVSDAKAMVPILDTDVIKQAAFEKNAQDIDVAALISPIFAVRSKAARH